MIPFLLLAQLIQAGSYERGMEAARAGQWEQARQEFLAGQALFPSDKRFPIELAGVEYRSGHADAARRYLRAALRLDARDVYANDFLGTLYYLDGNYEAALEYWNRIGKPRAGPLQVAPAAPLPAALLDRAVAFSPGEVLHRREYEATQEWLRGLNVFGSFRLEIAAREESGFDPILRWSPANPWIEAATSLGGVAAQSFRYQFENLGERAITATGAVRWDAQKRRLFGSVSAPLGNDPRRIYTLYTDLRGETWNIGAPEDFRLRKAEAGASLRFHPTARLHWQAGAILADRSYAGATDFDSGFTAAYTAGAGYRLASIPESGLTIDAGADWQLGRFFAPHGGLYSKAETELLARWNPLPAGSGYETTARARFGRLFGAAPFDEAFVLGRQRDDGLPLRGLTATRDGKKGNAPIGRQYFLLNIDFFKQLWNPLLLAVDGGALLDLGVVSRELPGVSTGSLAVTPGVQVRLRLPNGFALVVSYARDMRGGGAFDIGLK